MHVKKSTPKISIIMPVFNTIKYLEQSICCILNQTMHEWELLCVDNNSNDGSYEYIMELVKTDYRVKALKEINQGAGAARNKGIKHAIGEYIAFVDSDDWIENDLLETVYEESRKYDSDITIFNHNIHYEKTSAVTPSHREYIWNKLSEKDLEKIYNAKNNPWLLNMPVVPWNKIYKRELLKKNHIFFQEIKIRNDNSFHFETIIKANKIKLFNKVLYHQRKEREGQLTGVLDSRNLLIVDAAEKILKLLEQCKEKELYLPYLFHLVFGNMSYNYNRLNQKNRKELFFCISRFLLKFTEKDYKKYTKTFSKIKPKVFFFSMLRIQLLCYAAFDEFDKKYFKK